MKFIPVIYCSWHEELSGVWGHAWKTKQCRMRSDNLHRVGWIPSSVAKMGNRVTLLDTPDPERLWEIVSVGSVEDSDFEVS